MPNHQAQPLRIFQALADPTRMAIIERLSRGPLTVSDLAKPLPMALPSVLLHLKVLEQAGLLRSEKVGRVRTCQLASNGLAAAEAWLDARRADWDASLDRLSAYLDAAAEARGAKD